MLLNLSRRFLMSDGPLWLIVAAILLCVGAAARGEDWNLFAGDVAGETPPPAWQLFEPHQAPPSTTPPSSDVAEWNLFAPPQAAGPRLPRAILLTMPENCPPCREQEKEIEAFREWCRSQNKAWLVGDDPTNHIQIVDIESAAGEALCKQYDVDPGVPCWLYVTEAGVQTHIEGTIHRRYIAPFAKGEWP